MGARVWTVVFLISAAVAVPAESGTVRAWQRRINVEIPLPIPSVELSSVNPFASKVDVLPVLVSSTAPRKIEVAGTAVAAAFVDASGECRGAVPLEVPFPGLTRDLVDGLESARYEAARTGDRTRPSWVVLGVRIEGKVKEATVVNQELALPDPYDPPEPIRPALPPPAGHLLQLPATPADELTSLARPKKIRVRASGSEPVVSMQALVHVTAEGRCDRFVPIVLDSGLTRWLSGYLASWRMEPPQWNGEPVDAWIVFTARVKMKLGTLQSTSSRVLADRRYGPS